LIDWCFTARQHKIGQFVPIYQGGSERLRDDHRDSEKIIEDQRDSEMIRETQRRS